MLHSFAEADLREVLPRIQVPTLLLYGDADRRSPLEVVARDLHAKIPGSRLVILPGGGGKAPVRHGGRCRVSKHLWLAC
jgi:pimeloyl-ACP methyl ester carboxylesterase